MVKPTVKLTDRDKQELGCIADTPLYPIYKTVSKLASYLSLKKEELKYLTSKNINKYYIYLSQEVEKDSFSYVQLKDAGFSIGPNSVQSFNTRGGSIPKATFTAGGSLTLGMDNKSYIFYRTVYSKNTNKNNIILEEDNYLITWFIVEKTVYDSIM